MPHACLSLHPWSSLAFCASCTMFYLCITLPTALLNSSPCFALSFFHYSASPSFPVVLPQMLFSSLSWQHPNSCSLFYPPDLLCLFLVWLLVFICPTPASPKPCRLMISIHSRSEFRCFLPCAWMAYCYSVTVCSVWSVPESLKCSSRHKGLSMWQQWDISHFEETFLRPEGCGHQKGCSWASKMCKNRILWQFWEGWGEGGSGQGAEGCGQGPRWRLPHSSKVAFWTALLLPAPLWVCFSHALWGRES